MHRYEAVEKCIYCGALELPEGATKFGDEHIIPFSLGGNLVLPEASCKACEKVINREIETPINSHEWGNLRASRDFPTRNPKKRRTHVKLKRKDGSAFKAPIKDYSAPTPLYLFSEARILNGLPSGSDHLRWTMKMFTDHDAEMAMKSKFPDWDGVHVIKTRPHEFARLIAKIGHGYATAELGIDTFHPLTTEIIRGISDDYFYTVGGTWDIEAPITGGDHITNIRLLVEGSSMLVIVDVRLFSQAETPSYHAVVGRIDFQNPLHAAALEKHRNEGKLLVAK